LICHLTGVITSRHVVFDESKFPFAEVAPTSPPSDFDFLTNIESMPLVIGLRSSSGSVDGLAAPAGPSTRVVACDTVPASLAAPVPRVVASEAPTTDVLPPLNMHGLVPLIDPAMHVLSPGPPLPTCAPPTGPPCASSALSHRPAPEASPLCAPLCHDPSSADGPSSSVAAPVGLQHQDAANGSSQRPTSAVPIQPVTNDHGMTTRGKEGFRPPVHRLNLLAATISPIPKMYRGALSDQNWRAVMQEEIDVLHVNNTWDFVPRPAGVNVITEKWVYQHKYHPDGSLDRYKTCWVIGDSRNDQALTLMKLSVQWLSRQPSVL
jgi:hypothetical protein